MLGLNAFSGNTQAKRTGHINNRRCDRIRIIMLIYPINKLPVDFQGIYRQSFQMTKFGIISLDRSCLNDLITS